MRSVSKIAVTVCCLPLLMGAAVYRWVDEQGVVNYTQLKPEGVEAELMSADTGRRIASVTAATGSSASGQSQRDGEQTLSESQQKLLDDLRAAEAERQQKIAEVRDSNCRQARAVLDRLTSRGRIRVVGDDGVERVMPDEERHDRIDEAQRSVAANCADTASR